MDKAARFSVRTGGFVMTLSHSSANTRNAKTTGFVSYTHFPISFCLVTGYPFPLASLSLTLYGTISSWISPQNKHMVHTLHLPSSSLEVSKLGMRGILAAPLKAPSQKWVESESQRE